MRTDIIHFSDINTNKIFFENYKFDFKTDANNSNRDKMKKILVRAIESELTDKQKKCLIDYYFYSKKEKDIALELGLNISTVSRHIKNAKNRLRHIASYYM